MQSKANTIAEYLSELTPEKRAELEPIRQLIRETLPKAKEAMKHGMPTYSDSDDEMLCAFAAQKNNLALYLCGLGSHREDFNGLDCGKSCIRFKKLADLPLGTVRKVLRAPVTH